VSKRARKGTSKPTRRPAAPRPGGRKGGRLPPAHGVAWLRISLVVLWAAMLIGAVPPARAVALLAVGRFTEASVRVGGTVVEAIATSRRAEEHRELVLGYAERYGIPVELARAIDRAAAKEGIDPELAFRLVKVESEFRQRAVSEVGAIGFTQLMPATAAWLEPGITPEEIFDREKNLRLGFRYLRWLLMTYDGHIEEALHAYNRGPGTVARIRAAGGDPANGFADRVLRRGHPEPYRGTGLLPDPALHAEL